MDCSTDACRSASIVRTRFLPGVGCTTPLTRLGRPTASTSTCREPLSPGETSHTQPPHRSFPHVGRHGESETPLSPAPRVRSHRHAQECVCRTVHADNCGDRTYVLSPRETRGYVPLDTSPPAPRAHPP